MDFPYSVLPSIVISQINVYEPQIKNARTTDVLYVPPANPPTIESIHVEVKNLREGGGLIGVEAVEKPYFRC